VGLLGWAAVTRLARVIAVKVPHHVTQRGNARQYILDNDADRAVYLDLLRDYTALSGVSVLGYCLMSNHVHLVLRPDRPLALASAMKQTSGRYAAYWNAGHRSSGHVWQGRFYSCPLDEPHLWAALRYVELNPLRAGLVAEPSLWPWSSAGAHLGACAPALALEMEAWRKRWTCAEWKKFLGTAEEQETEIIEIRRSTHTGRPLGDEAFVRRLEQATRRILAPQKGGRPTSRLGDSAQQELTFGSLPRVAK